MPTSRLPAVRRLGGLGGPVLILVVALGGAAGACTGEHPSQATGPVAATDAPMATTAAPGPVDPMVPDAQAISAAWAARPAFVHQAHERTQAAYAYALARPDVLEWLPCYCGCGAMGHRSNLDCFLLPREEPGDPLAFEEHGSYCDVCVETALMADEMLRSGSTLIQVRAAVDARFGGLAPGTPTELPPAG